MSAAATVTRPPALRSLLELYRLLLRMQTTVIRLAGIGALGVLAVGLAGLARQDDRPVRAATEVVAAYGIALVVPLAALWLATSATADLVDDRLLVYLWLKPVARWQLPAAAVLATVTVVGPLVGLPLVVAMLVAGVAELAAPVLLATVLAVAAYAGVFTAAGLWLHRALWWGLAYVLVWENGLARAVPGADRLSIAGYALSVVEDAANVSIDLGGRSYGAAVAVPLVLAVLGWLLATIRYRRAEVD